MKKFFQFLSGVICLFLIHRFCIYFFGVGIIGMALDLIFLASFAIVIAALIWPVMTLIKLILRRIVSEENQDQIYILCRYPIYWMVIFVFFLGPHLWMSHRLAPLKKAFVAVSNGVEPVIYSTGEVDPGGKPIIAADFGGKLDELIQIRTLVLIAHHYVPIGTGRWQTMSNYGPSMPMAYIYTFLPKDTYWFLVVKIFGVKAEEENIENEVPENQIDKDGNLIV